MTATQEPGEEEAAEHIKAFPPLAPSLTDVFAGARHASPLLPFVPDQDLTGQALDPAVIEKPTTAPLSPDEHVRRRLIVAAGVAYLVVVVAQIVFALTLSVTDYQLVAGILTGAASLTAGALGAAVTYYFTHKN